MIEKIINTSFVVSAVILVSAGIMATYWQFIDDPIVNRINMQKVVNAGDIHPGGRLRLHVVGCSFFPSVANSGSRTIRNEFTFRLSDQSVVAGCFDSTKEYPIPLDAHIGQHTYQFCAEWRINPIKTVLHCNEPVQFDVTPTTNRPTG